MNKILSVPSALLCAGLMAVCGTSCEDANVRKLKTDVAVAQASAPMPAGVLGQIQAVSYDAADNSVTFTLTQSATGIDSTFAAAHTAECLPLVGLVLNRGSQAEVFHQMAKAGATAKVGYGGKPVFEIPADSIKAALDYPLTGRQAAMIELQGYAAAVNSRVPMALVEGTSLRGVAVNDSALVYNMVLEGGNLTPAWLRANVPEMRHNLWNMMKANASTGEGKEVYTTLFDNSLNVEYVFGDTGSTPVRLVFPYKEVYFLTK